VVVLFFFLWVGGGGGGGRQDPLPPNPGNTPEFTSLDQYIVASDGEFDNETTTTLTFYFAQDVKDLTESNISISDGTNRIAAGHAKKSGLQGEGRTWTLYVDEIKQGNVWVSIKKDGITSEEKKIAVYENTFKWSVSANGKNNETTTTKLTISFNGVSLTQDNIKISNYGGEASITGFNQGDFGTTSCTVNVNVARAGYITVEIDKRAADNLGVYRTMERSKPVLVHKAGEDTGNRVNWSVSADEGRDAGTSAINISFVSPVAGLTLDDVEILGEAVATGVSGGGSDWKLNLKPVTVEEVVQFTLRKNGLASYTTLLPVYKKTSITWRAKADGSSTGIASTAITLTFARPVEAADIAQAVSFNSQNVAVLSDVSSVSGFSKTVVLPITVVDEGQVKVSVSMEGVAAGEKTVNVFKVLAKQIKTIEELVEDIKATTGNSEDNPYNVDAALAKNLITSIDDLRLLINGVGIIDPKNLSENDRYIKLDLSECDIGGFNEKVISNASATKYVPVTELVLPKNIIVLNGNAFMAWNKLKKLTIAATGLDTMTKAFNACTALETVDISGCTALAIVGESAFDGCSNLVEVKLPSSVTEFGLKAFNACKLKSMYTNADAKIENTLIFPAGLVTIGNAALMGSSSIIPDATSVKVGANLTTIGMQFLQYYKNLTAVELPASVTSIGQNLCLNCSALTEFKINATTPPALTSASCFSGTNASLAIKVPNASVDAYKAASGWSTATIVAKIVGF
jgi:hypothetical protein